MSAEVQGGWCAGVEQGEASMAVLVQEMVLPEVSFVLHTASPLGNDPEVGRLPSPLASMILTKG